MKREVDRRQALAAFGTVSLGGLLAACGGDDDGGGGSPSAKTKPTPKTLTERMDGAARCEQTVEQTEGPYYFDADSIRRDIREDRKGTALALALRVREAGSCEPIENAIVDIWHCDAGGVYSGFESGQGERFLRGAQATNADGIARFTTIYPGWYQGRTVHIHAKVHLDRQTVLTTQLYFPDASSDRVFTNRRYARGQRDQTNQTDGIFDDSLVLDLAREDGGLMGLMTLDVRRA